jgi:hypothetical protein
MRAESAVTAIYRAHVAGLAALGAIVLAVNAESDGELPFANAAIFVAGAIFLCLIACHANYRTSHGTLPS